jgi:glycosyltransferase involved in cell wall biosynthesis
MARPVVVMRVGGLPEVVMHQKTGLLVEQDNREGLTEAMGFLLEHPAAAAHMGQAARRQVLRVFTAISACVERVNEDRFPI